MVDWIGDIPAMPNQISTDVPAMENDFEFLFNRTTLTDKIIDIDDWDMDADASVTVTHGLSLANIRAISSFIRNDDNDLYHELTSRVEQNSDTGSIEVDATDVTLRRTASGFFDSTEYNATTFNRGWVIVKYVTP